MAIEVFVNVRAVTGTATTISIEVTIRHLASSQEVSTQFTVLRSVVTPSNVVGGLKNQIIAYALAQYGVVLTASEILVFGAPA